MRLDRLIAGLPIALHAGDGARDITGLTDDSRKVKPGFLFIARPDPKGGPGGAAFVAQAVACGAVAVLLPGGAGLPPVDQVPAAVAVLELAPGTPFDQSVAGRLANAFHGDPLSRIKVVAVTGTNGKTTTATLAQQLLNARGVKCGMIGTVSVDCGRGPKPAELTTPGAVELVECFAEMVGNGCAACAIEASSHALDQGRVGMIPFAAAAFTNLTGDHLDYHGTMENYGAAKKKLFDSLVPESTAIVNGTDAWAERMLSDCRAGSKWRTGSLADQLEDTQREFSDPEFEDSRQGMPLCFEPRRDEMPVWLSFVASARTTAGTQAIFSGPWGEADAFLPLAGDHNLMNALQACALAHAVAPVEGIALARQIERLTPVPGRLEFVGPDWSAGKNAVGGGADEGGLVSMPRQNAVEVPPVAARPAELPTVLVDYAHTHDAIERVALALRPLVDHVKGKLVIVFGCGGDRDRTKRPKMARVACAVADRVVVTSDNPRTEDPQAIIAEILAGVPAEAQVKVKVLPDRAEAIALAVKEAAPNDTVLICGKGHEDYQVIGKTKHHFDDREQAASALKARMA